MYFTKILLADAGSNAGRGKSTRALTDSGLPSFSFWKEIVNTFTPAGHIAAPAQTVLPPDDTLDLRPTTTITPGMSPKPSGCFAPPKI